jgi:hypothetical protein
LSSAAPAGLVQPPDPCDAGGTHMNGMTISTTTRTLLDLVERAVVTPLAS